MKRTTMELGGHGPVLVFDDVDVDAVLNTVVPQKYRNAGQVCVSPTRFIVQESIYDRFRDGFTERAKAIKVGNGLADGTQMGPMANLRTSMLSFNIVGIPIIFLMLAIAKRAQRDEEGLLARAAMGAH